MADRRRVLKVDARLPDVAESLAGIAFETALQQDLHRCRDFGGKLREVDGTHQHRRHGLRDRLGLERRVTRKHLVEDHAEGPDVRPPVDGAALGLLGAHVGGRAQDGAHLGHRGGDRGGVREVSFVDAVAGVGPGQTEVEDLDLARVGDLHVRGLEVAVDDALLVGFLQPLGDLGGDLHRLADRQGAAFEAHGKILALHQFHDEETLSARLPPGRRCPRCSDG